MLGSDSIVALCVEAGGHYNWLHTSACSVWEFRSSPRRDILATFGSSHILILVCLYFGCRFSYKCALCALVGLWDRGYLSIYALLSSGPFTFGMLGILSPILSPSTDPGVRLGGITTPYCAHRFGVVTFLPLLHLWRMLTPFSRFLHQWSPSQGW